MFKLFKTKRKWSKTTSSEGRFSFRVFTDAHLFSKYNDNKELYETIRLAPNDGRTVLLGDIVDRACCKLSDLPEATRFMQMLVKRFGDAYVFGNHERSGINILVYIITLPDGRRAGFTHNDLLGDYDKWFKYRHKPAGASWLKRRTVMFLDTLDWLKAQRPIPEKYFTNALALMEENNLDVLIGGHYHVATPRFYEDSTTGYKKEIFTLPAHQDNRIWV